MSGYWKVTSLESGTLPYFVWADNGAHAIRMVEDFAGGLPPQKTKAVLIGRNQLPDQAMVLGEPEELTAERNKEEEF